MSRVLVTARWPVGGIRTFLKYVYSDPEYVGHELVFALPAFDESKQLQRDLAHRSAAWHWLEPTSRGYFGALRQLLRREPFDLVHSHGFTSLFAVTAARPKCSHLVTVHDVLLDKQLAGLKGGLKRLALRLCLSRATVVHAVSQSCADNLVQMVSPSDSVQSRIKVISNGIDTAPFLSATPTDLREQLNVADDTLLLGFFGRFMSQKGFRFIADAVDLLRTGNERPVCIVCVGSGGYKAREQRVLQDRQIADSFRFVDFVPHVGTLMKSVDAVLMPSLWEACGLVAMEVMVSGIPLIASDIPALRELGEGTPTQFVPPADSATLARAIADFDGESQQIASAAYSDAASRRFSVASTSRDLGQLYDAVIAGDANATGSPAGTHRGR